MADSRLAWLTLEEKVALLTGADFWSTRPMPMINLPGILLSDGAAGVRGAAWDERDASLLLPNPTALAATWDPDLVERAGALLGAEARRKGVHVLLAPVLNLHRTPLGGRHFECFSEDPLLTAEIGAAYVRGVQSRGVAATAKHYVGNETERDRMTYDARIGERVLREQYLVPFEAAVRAGAWVVMAAYNSVNGHPMAEHRELLEEVLKREWGFDGLVVSDWTAARSTLPTALAGLDLAMPGPWGPWGDALVAAVEAGAVPEAAVDAKVIRLLRLADRVGARVGGVRSSAGPVPPVRPEHAVPVDPGDATALLSALASRAAVLLRNTGVLPLPDGLRRVALVGPNAVRFAVQGGGSAHVTPPHVVDLAVGLRRALPPEVTMSVHAGVYPWHSLPELEPAAPLTVRFRDAAGTELGSQRRTAARWVFLPGPHGLPDGTAEVVVTGAVLPGVTGVHRLAVQGLGRYTLDLAGERTEHRLEAPEGDLIGSFLRPPQAVVEVPLRAGVPAPFTLCHQVPAGMPVAVFGLGHAPPRGSDGEEMDAAVAAARDADVAVVVVGTSEEVECEGFDRDTLTLPGRQDALVSAVAAVNPRTVVVVNAGAPVTMPWRDEVAAVLWGWLPGQEGGTGLADVLVGRAEPGGRLPTTLPAVEADVPVPGTAPVAGTIEYEPLIGYRAYADRGTVPGYPFGHGLGYTTWEYEDMAVTGDGSGGLRVAVTVRNTGRRPGREVVQCYREEDPLRLVGFAAVRAGPGERATAVVEVAARTLARWEPGAGWRPPAGQHRLAAGRSAGDLRLW